MKKSISIILVLCMVLGCFVASSSTAFAAGIEQHTTADGDYIEIRTVEDLYMVNNDLSGNYRLMNDIDLSEATSTGGDWDFGGRGWEPIGSNGNYGKNPFTGVFDGNGYEIKGMRIHVMSAYSGYLSNLPSSVTDRNEIYLGLFTANSGTIRNLTVSGSITGYGYLRYVGGIVGINNGGTIERCVNKCNMTLSYASDYTHMWSGIAGTSSGGLITECYNTGDISISTSKSGGYYASGITHEGCTVTNCYNIGNITSKDSSYYADNAYAAGISQNGAVSECYNIGKISSYADNQYAVSKNVTNGYYLEGTGKDTSGTKSLTAAQMKMKAMYKGFDFDNVWFIDTSSDYPYPQLRNNSFYEYPLTEIKLEDMKFDIDTFGTLTVEYIPDYTTDSRDITWISSDDSVASVDEYGVVTAHKKGKATITATGFGGVQATCTVQVLVPMTAITFESSAVTIPRGTRQKVPFIVSPSDTTDTYNVASSDINIATVDKFGNVTAKKIGTAVITVTSSRGLEQTCVVTVNSPASSITLSEDSKALFVGKSFSLMAEMIPNDTTDSVKWTSSNEDVAVVTPEGLVTAIAKGNATITATTDSGISAECAITVESNIAATTIYLAYQETDYNGSEKLPAVSVYYNGDKLFENTDYSLSYLNNIDAGNASVYVTSLHDGTEVEKNFTIHPLTVKALDISYKTSMTYTGSPLMAVEEITYQSLRLTQGTDYELQYADNTVVGTASVTVTGLGNFSGTTTKSFAITPKSAALLTVTLGATSYRYDGSAKYPDVTVRDGAKELTEGTDYEVRYSGNTNAGDAVVTVTGLNNYGGSTTAGFKIYAKSLADAEMSLSNTVFAFDGTNKCPKVTVTDGEVVLKENTDFTVEYKNNIASGTATATVIGKGNYTGTLAADYRIIQLGDANLDGIISISDVTEIQRYLAEMISFTDEQLVLADTNGDGAITISDATHLQKYLAEYDGIVLGKQS